MSLLIVLSASQLTVNGARAIAIVTCPGSMLSTIMDLTPRRATVVAGWLFMKGDEPKILVTDAGDVTFYGEPAYVQ